MKTNKESKFPNNAAYVCRLPFHTAPLDKSNPLLHTHFPIQGEPEEERNEGRMTGREGRRERGHWKSDG
jgi:hypothetical protein